MRRTSVLTLAIALGCGGGAPDPTPFPSRSESSMHPRPAAESTIATTPRSELQAQTIAALEGFTHEMCACTDSACADAVAATLTGWNERVAQKYHVDGDDQGDAAAANRIAELSNTYGKCRTKLALPSTPPPRTLAAVPEGAPDECLRYQLTVEVYVTCARVPQDQRDVIFAAYQDQASTWDTFDFARATPAALKRIASKCKKARDALRRRDPARHGRAEPDARTAQLRARAVLLASDVSRRDASAAVQPGCALRRPDGRTANVTFERDGAVT